MTEEQFTEAFGHVVQDSPWAVERAFEQRPFADTLALREAFQDAVLTGTTEEQLELIKSFHDLGAEDETGQAIAVDHVAADQPRRGRPRRGRGDRRGVPQNFGFPLIVCAREIDRFDRVCDLGWARMANSPTPSTPSH